MMIRKVCLCLFLLLIPLIGLPAGSVDGAAFTMQREGAPPDAQDRSEAAAIITADGHQTVLAPRMLKNKAGDEAAPAAGDQSERRVRYKPYIDGEGDRK